MLLPPQSYCILMFFFSFLHQINGFLVFKSNCLLYQYQYRRNTVVILDKDRRWIENPLHFLNVQDFVFYYGDRDDWWGDWNAKETRLIYHKLLPIYHPLYFSCCEMETLAFHAFQTRREAKKYARRRSRFYIRWFSICIDGVRSLWRYKRWNSLGINFQQLWNKYKQQIQQQDPSLEQEELDNKIYRLILYKSCQTNHWIDSLCVAK